MVLLACPGRGLVHGHPHMRQRTKVEGRRARTWPGGLSLYPPLTPRPLYQALWATAGTQTPPGAGPGCHPPPSSSERTGLRVGHMASWSHQVPCPPRPKLTPSPAPRHLGAERGPEPGPGRRKEGAELLLRQWGGRGRQKGRSWGWGGASCTYRRELCAQKPMAVPSHMACSPPPGSSRTPLTRAALQREARERV